MVHIIMGNIAEVDTIMNNIAEVCIIVGSITDVDIILDNIGAVNIVGKAAKSDPFFWPISPSLVERAANIFTSLFKLISFLKVCPAKTKVALKYRVMFLLLKTIYVQ
jgi:hypothetical protein